MISNVTLNCGDDVAISVCRLVIHCASDCVTRCAMSQYRDAGVVVSEAIDFGSLPNDYFARASVTDSSNDSSTDSSNGFASHLGLANDRLSHHVIGGSPSCRDDLSRETSTRDHF